MTLEVDGVTVCYGATTALDRCSIAVPTGQVLAVVGPSGSGKSTLLRAIAGLEPLEEGRILLDGRDLAGVPTHRRGLGLMFQDHGLFGHLSVVGNIEYGLRMQGMSAERRRARVAELLELVGLTGFGDRRSDQLSGGEAQRVALARALAPRPGLLMLDEPLGSLDRALREQLTGELRRLLSAMDQTAVHVTHDQVEAFAVADRVAVLADGAVQAEGAPAELWADPGSRFVAEFLGHRNLWTVELGAGGVVRWRGEELGRVGDDHPLAGREAGPHPVVVPITAVSAVPLEGAVGAGRPPLTIPVTAVDVVFRQGLHRVTARLVEDDGPCPRLVDEDPSSPPAALVHVETSQPVTVGQPLVVTVDLSAVRPLTA